MFTHQVSSIFGNLKQMYSIYFLQFKAFHYNIPKFMYPFSSKKTEVIRLKVFLSFLCYLPLFLLSFSGINVPTFFPKLLHLCFLVDLSSSSFENMVSFSELGWMAESRVGTGGVWEKHINRCQRDQPKGPYWEKLHSLPWITLFSQSLNRSLLRIFFSLLILFVINSY